MRSQAKASGDAVDAYIAMFPETTREGLECLRAVTLAAAPGITERVSYGIMTFDYKGRRLIYFGGWQRHIGFYPVTEGIEKTLGDEIKPYKSGKGSMRFMLDKPLPLDLVRRLVQCRLEEVTAAYKEGRKA